MIIPTINASVIEQTRFKDPDNYRSKEGVGHETVPAHLDPDKDKERPQGPNSDDGEHLRGGEEVSGDEKDQTRVDICPTGPCTVGYCPANPPASWHIGNPPNGTEKKFMRPILVENFPGGTSCAKEIFCQGRGCNRIPTN